MDKEDDTDEFSWIMLYLALEVSGGGLLNCKINQWILLP